MFRIDRSMIDKSQPVPVGTQLRGLLAYIISHGDMPYGTRLPSVRDLAEELAVAPVTVNQVYRDLRLAGLIEIRRGRGAFVARDPDRKLGTAAPAVQLRRQIDILLDKASELQVDPGFLVSMITAQLQVRRTRRGLRLVFVGIFRQPAQDYVADLRRVLLPEDEIEIVTIDELRADPEAVALCGRADAALTFVHREAEVAALIPDTEIITIRFIPSNATRQALAALDPRSRLLAVSHFQEYLAIMRPSIQQFAPHLSDIRVTYSGAEKLAQAIADRDAVVYATGADAVAELVPEGVPCFEYRHVPDPGEVDRILVPVLTQKRAEKLARQEPRRTVAADKATAAP